MRRITIEHQGRQAAGEELLFTVTSGEGWAEYKLDDGTIAKIRTIATRWVRLDDRNPDGSPMYIANYQTLVTASVAPHMMVDEAARTAAEAPRDLPPPLALPPGNVGNVHHDETPPPPVGEENQEKSQ